MSFQEGERKDRLKILTVAGGSTAVEATLAFAQIKAGGHEKLHI